MPRAITVTQLLRAAGAFTVRESTAGVPGWVCADGVGRMAWLASLVGARRIASRLNLRRAFEQRTAVCRQR
jgi:hypothetical protein